MNFNQLTEVPATIDNLHTLQDLSVFSAVRRSQLHAASVLLLLLWAASGYVSILGTTPGGLPIGASKGKIERYVARAELCVARVSTASARFQDAKYDRVEIISIHSCATPPHPPPPIPRVSFARPHAHASPGPAGSNASVSREMGWNDLTVLPAAVGNFSNLINFDFSSNRLQTLPDTITNLRSLTFMCV